MLLRDFVNKKMASADKEASAEGYPLELSNCKKYKPMRDLKIYGNSFQDGTPSPETPIEVQSVGELVTDEADDNCGKYKIPVVVKGINLFDKTKVSGGYINDANGEYRPTSDGTSYVSDYIEIPPNQKFYITHTETNQLAAFYDENKQFVKGIYGYGRSHESPSNAKYIRITVRADYMDTMQVQLGSVSTEYEPYIEPVTTNIFLDEPLRKLGDYADYIDFKENKVVRNIGSEKLSEIPFNGKSGVSTSNSFYASYSLSTGVIKSKGFINTDYDTEQFDIVGYELCEKIPITSYRYIRSNKNVYGMVFTNSNNGKSNEIRVGIPVSVASTLDDFKTWVINNDCNIYYVLLNQIEEPLNIDLPKLNAKTTIIEVDTSLAPSNAYGKYIKK